MSDVRPELQQIREALTCRTTGTVAQARAVLHEIGWVVLVDNRWGHDSIPAPNLDCAKSVIFRTRKLARDAAAPAEPPERPEIP